MEIIVRHGHTEFEFFNEDSSMKAIMDSIDRAIVKQDDELGVPGVDDE